MQYTVGTATAVRHGNVYVAPFGTAAASNSEAGHRYDADPGLDFSLGT